MALKKRPPEFKKNWSRLDVRTRPRRRRHSALLSLVLFLFFSLTAPQTAHSYNACEMLSLPSVPISGRYKGSTGVEIETEFRTIHPLLTTEDGTLKPLVPHLKSMPPFLEARLKDESADQILWSSLSVLEAEKIYDALHDPERFGRGERTIPGMKFKKWVKVGEKIPEISPGFYRDDHEGTFLDMEKIFEKERIEFQSAEMNRSVELHARPNYKFIHSTLVELPRLFYRLFSSLNIFSPRLFSMHEHVTSTFPKLRQLVRSGKVNEDDAFFTYTEWLRRQNLNLELFYLSKIRALDTLIADDGYIYFDHIRNYETVHQEILRAAHEPQNNAPRILGFLSPRSPGTYDSSSLWGVEGRFFETLPGGELEADLQLIYAHIFQGFQNEKFLKNTSELRRWREWITAKKESEFDAITWDHSGNSRWRPTPTMRRFLHDANLSKLFTFGHPESYMEKEWKTGRHRELSLLFHDWSLDPLFYTSPQIAEKIREEQIRTLKFLSSTITHYETGPTHPQSYVITKAVRDFTRKSKLDLWFRLSGQFF
jgi:hypothetical protein